MKAVGWLMGVNGATTRHATHREFNRLQPDREKTVAKMTDQTEPDDAADLPADLTKVALVQMYAILTKIRRMAGKKLSNAMHEDMQQLGATLDSLINSDTPRDTSHTKQ